MTIRSKPGHRRPAPGRFAADKEGPAPGRFAADRDVETSSSSSQATTPGDFVRFEPLDPPETLNNSAVHKDLCLQLEIGTGDHKSREIWDRALRCPGHEVTNPLDDMYPGKKYLTVVKKTREIADAEPPNWVNQVQTRLKGMQQSYFTSLNTSLRQQHAGRYGNLARDLYHDENFPRSFLQNFPHSLDSISKARVMVIVDSTMLPRASREWLLMDVVLSTLPFSTVQQMAQLVLAIYHHTGPIENNYRPKPPNTIIICNLFDHLAVKGTLNKVAGAETPDNIELFANQVKDYVNSMEHAAAELKNKLNVSTIFTSPPGFHLTSPAG